MPFRAKLVAVFGTALAILVFLSILSYRRTLQDDDDEAWISHTHFVLEKLDALTGALVDAETNQRAFIITGEDAYLVPYRSAMQNSIDGVQALLQLTSDNPGQQRFLNQLGPLVTQRSAELDDRIGMRRRSAVVTPALIDAGQAHMAEIQGLISSMRLEEQQLLNKRIEVAKATSASLKGAIILGNALAFVFLLAAALIIHHEMERRRHTEEALRQSEERFRLMISGLQDYAMLMLDPQGQIVNWNAGAERIKGYSAKEIIGQHFSRFYPREDIDAGKPSSELEAAAKEGRFEDEGWRVRKDGSRFWANVVITAMRDQNGRLRGFGKVTRDMTERKQNEDRLRIRTAHLETANKELEAFCYSVAHDLRAPLRGIDGFSQALIEDYADQLDDQGKECLQRVRLSAQRMGTLIDDLLNLSRIARTEMHREIVDLSSIADQVATDLCTRDPRRNVTFVIEPGLQAKADARLLRIALENLLGNSWKFTSKREDARIEVGCARENGKSAYFVRDNGVGFDPVHARKLFGAFQRLHGMNEFPGTGIGLATAQRIIQRHGGSIWADAELGHGATFYFNL